MTRLLASVTTLAEAKRVMSAGADIIDIKDPVRGALGAVNLDDMAEIVSCIKGHCLVSATIGDLPLHSERTAAAIRETSGTGVDIVKVGLFADSLTAENIRILADETRRGVDLVLVCFADRYFQLPDFMALREAGLFGVMLDTADKASGNLPKLKSKHQLKHFITRARAAGLKTGLAGSLRQEDIAPLLSLGPDYLGFRGALCRERKREQAIDYRAVLQVRSMIPMEHDVTSEIAVKTGG